MLRIRENAEQIALLKGEPAERRRLMAHFARVRENWTAIMNRQKRLTFFTAGYNQVQVIVPILAAGPVYFAGAICLGGLMQTASAFGRVEGALSFFVKAYPQLAQWKSIIERLDGFEQSIADAASRRGALDVVEGSAGDTISAMALNLAKPCGSSLLKMKTLELRAGEATLLTGRSGTGKSTLLRVLAGIWPHAQGRIEIPTGIRLTERSPASQQLLKTDENRCVRIKPARLALPQPTAPGNLCGSRAGVLTGLSGRRK